MKGMQKIKRGNGFRGVVSYCFDHDGGHIIGGNMSGTTARELSTEFRLGRQQRPDIKKPVWHNSLRLPDGEHLDDERWRTIAQDYMRGLGFTDDHQFAIFKHTDGDSEHIHIVANRVSLVGSVYLGQNENLKSTKLISQLERAHKLAITPGAPDDIRPAKRKLKKNEIEASARTGIVPPRAAIQFAIDTVADQHPRNLNAFREALAARGVTLHIHVDPATNKPRGLSFEKDGIRFAGSQLGNDYKFSRLSERLSAKPAASAAPLAHNEENDMQNPFRRRPATTTRPSTPTPVPATTTTTQNGIASALPAAVRHLAPATQTPTLGGKLMPVKTESGINLFWRDRDKPSYRWKADEQRLDMLATPSPKSVAALFDLAQEAGIGMPSLKIYGTPEFQLAACEEAARRGIPVDTKDLDPAAREAYEQAFDAHHGNAANSLVSSAYESDDAYREKLAAQREAESRKNAARDAAKDDGDGPGHPGRMR